MSSKTVLSHNRYGFASFVGRDARFNEDWW